MINFLDIMHRPIFYFKRHFGDWIPSPSSVKESALLDPVSKPRDLSPDAGSASGVSTSDYVA
jgi:hypothetical protein